MGENNSFTNVSRYSDLDFNLNINEELCKHVAGFVSECKKIVKQLPCSNFNFSLNEKFWLQ